MSEKRCHYAVITETRHGWRVQIGTEYEIKPFLRDGKPLTRHEELASHWRPTRKWAERFAARRLRRANERDRFERERERYEIT